VGHFGDTVADRKKLQQALIDAGYNVGPDGADGVWGDNTASAIRAYRRDHGMNQAAVVDNQLLRYLRLGPQLISEPGTLAHDLFIQIALKTFVLPNLQKGLLIMSAALAGYKTLILGVVTIVVGVLALMGWDIPGFTHVPGGLTIDAGLAMIFLRLGIKNAVTDLVEKVISGLGK